MSLNYKKILIKSLFTIGGITAGYLYWRFIGCASGTCPITSTWYTSSIAGGIMGLLLSDSIVKKNN